MQKYCGKLIMIIGAGIFQAVAAKEAKKLGLKVLSTDFNPKAPGFELSDYKALVSTSDISATVDYALKFNREVRRIDGVITVGTDVSRTVAGVADALGLTGVSPQTALCATNKARMRECFQKNNVPAPKWMEISTVQEAESAVAKLGLPLVIKPVDNMGARGVRKIVSKNDIPEAFAKAVENSRTGKAIIEEFMEGPELSVDTLVYNGEVHLLTIADRHIEGDIYFVEKGHTVPSIISDETKKEVLEVMKKGIKAVGITCGASKADMKITKDGPKIGEITARLSGGYHSQFTDPLATGMRSIKAAIDIALGFELDLDDITPKRNYTACERAIIPEPGIVKAIEGLDKLNDIAGFKHIFLHVKEGDKVSPVISNMGKSANIICCAPTREEAFESVDNVLKTVRIITQ